MPLCIVEWLVRGEAVLQSVVAGLTAKKLSPNNRYLEGTLAALAQIYRDAFQVTRDKCAEFNELVVKSVVFGEAGPEAKLQALRMFGWFLASVPADMARQASEGLLRLLGSILNQRYIPLKTNSRYLLNSARKSKRMHRDACRNTSS